jgi:hypothetical protein
MANMDAYLRQVTETAYPDRLTAFLHLAGVEPYLAGMPVAYRDGDAFRVAEEDMLRPHVDGEGTAICDYGEGWHESIGNAWHPDVAEWMRVDGVMLFLEGHADELAIAAIENEEDDSRMLLAYSR